MSPLVERLAACAHLEAGGRRERRDVERRWRESFVPTIKRDVRVGSLWHLCSERVVESLEGPDADEAYDTQVDEDFVVWFDAPNDEVLFCRGRLPTAGEWRSMIEDVGVRLDLYVASSTFTWSYVRTHEAVWELGPYFVTTLSPHNEQRS